MALRKTLETRLDETVEALEMGDRALATQRMTGRTRTALDALLVETASMARQQRESMQSRQALTLQINFESIYIVAALGIAALLLGILMSALMTRRISIPLGQSVDFVGRIAGGDLVHEVAAASRDEFGQLQGGMAHMRHRLREMIGGILDNAARVPSANAGKGGPTCDASKQLQYSWLRGLAGHHADFWQVTGDALDFAMSTLHVDDAVLHARLMNFYLGIAAYPEMPATLQ